MRNKPTKLEHGEWPLAGRLVLVLVLYALYLPLSGYQPQHLRFDAGQYWELSLKFFQQGRFSLLHYDEPVRGYLGPLLVQPGRLLCHLTGWPALRGAQALGAGWAALLFGGAIPAAWRLGSGQALSGRRWLLLVGLGFVFWRDYFNFPLSDMPALTLLLLGLAALWRPHWGWTLAAGLLLAGALNIRPIYLASLPPVLWLLIRKPGRGLRHGAFAAGAALVLLPQLLINLRHFGQATPLVLAAPATKRALYLQQLTWGTAFQRVETSLMPEYPRQVLFADPAGQAALAVGPGAAFNSYPDFIHFTRKHPVDFAVRCARHVFNGLDIRFATPYLRELHPSGQAGLRVLNYVLLAAALALVLAGWRNRPRSQKLQGPATALLLALLLPCALAIPTAMECRFLLPLHLLLLTLVAASARPLAWLQQAGPGRRALACLLLLGWVWGCWQLSEDTARYLQPESAARRYE
ncbi:hypothetical protein [Hymenobacter saemangeumensis]|uniref:hypothetical protein n=1 Tax=Hymenobacter saemangeumensis TaxID=1084522 RepID=UPI0031E849DC